MKPKKAATKPESVRRIKRSTVRIPVMIEYGLLDRTDKYAKQRGLTRSALIAKALEAVIGRAG